MKGHDRRSHDRRSLFCRQLSRGLRKFVRIAWSNIKEHHAEDSIGLLQSSIDHQSPFSSLFNRDCIILHAFSSNINNHVPCPCHSLPFSLTFLCWMPMYMNVTSPFSSCIVGLPAAKISQTHRMSKVMPPE